MQKRTSCTAIISHGLKSFFSILSNSFTDGQEHALRDYIETLVMLQYNYR